MVTNNKVLTVSYGTFSCTLEGFEESFDTMKAIAEYFRDLAADDRYFGAEPPTPDAEMLARIAEKEITRRVSARLDHGAIVLSAGEPKDENEARPEQVEQHVAKAAPEAQPGPEPQAAPEPVAEAPVIEEVVAQAAVPAVEDTPAEGLVDVPVEDVAEAVVEDAPVAAEKVIEEEDAPAPVEETVAEDVLAEAPVAEDTPAEVEADVAEVAVTEEPAPEAGFEGTPEPVSEDNIADSVMAAIADDSLPEAKVTPVVDIIEETIEEVAAEDIVEVASSEVDLAGISAAVSAVDALSDDQLQTDSEADTSDLLILDAPVESNSADPFAENAADNAVEAADWEDAADEPEFEENSIAAKLERIRAVVARVEAEPDTAAVDAEDDQPELTTAEAPADSNIFDEELAPMDLTPINAEDDEAVEAAAELTEDIVMSKAEVEDAEIVDVLAEESPTPEKVVAEEEAKPEPVVQKVRPLRARVVRMKKADFEDAVASGQLEASADEDGETVQSPAPEAPKPTSLTPEDEADLLAELAQVEAELKLSDVAQAAPKAAPQDDAQVVLDTPVAPEVETMGEPRQQPEPDLSRLMAKANSEMEEPQGKGRRSAIAHLRAAVAATRAEKRAGNDGKGKDDTVAYRDDLASVVRAVPGGKSGEAKSSKSSAAPLKLVAAQRVDATEQNKSEQPAQQEPESVQKAPRRVPVRPRRVSSDQLDRDEAAKSAAPVSAKGTTLSGFADYAASMGASQLPESTEAAAAYLTYVEGLERFSRPMLMRMSREVNIPQFTREEGLRAFGQLLREKKIDKVAGGRFTANASINFKPRDSKAG
ncbi:hypothetical protein [Shimia sagamensis]|uniref:Lipoprotein n=1 Tax=Shimia sagamensis TaxID=1566352 RepID=A0ABY1P4V4_9RHOB|nr:hypothetical protein [Shimia sagamensis]SMP24034.1 hypothetical protein SAMN06265373_104469 [Shimia sagamensis]